MTKINKLEMKGFKSFNNKTELLFGNTFNCILGPNGSGKSNVLDAICFVLGKGSSKALRAEKSANLIYNGGKNKHGAGKGEVSIYFDNQDGTFKVEAKEIKITRIIKKTGQSAYKINDKTVTRNQILDLLSQAKINPDGYNIVLQGDVVRFTEMPTDKRRKTIEELAGINIYEEKKQKATRELEKVEEKLSGAELILKEKKSHLHELKKDRDEALKYKELNDKIRHNKGAYAKIQLEKKEVEFEDVDKKKKEATEVFEKHEGKVKELKGKNQESKEELEGIAREIEEKGEKEQITLSKELEHMRIEMAKDRERTNTLQNELDRIAQRREQLEENKKDIDAKIKEVEGEKNAFSDEIQSKEKEKRQVEEAIERFKKKNKLGEDVENLDKEIEALDKKEEAKQEEINKLRQEQQEKIREKDKYEFMLSTLDERIKKVKEVEKENNKELEELKNKQVAFKNASTELSKRLNDDAALASSISSLRQDVQHYEEQLGKLQVREQSQREVSLQNKAVELILNNKKQFNGVYGTIASLGKVSSKYATALEIAAGGRVQSLVVEDDSIASQCIKFLKEKKVGTATFLPLNKMKEATIDSSLKKAPGAVDFAINLVSFDSKYKKAFSYVLGNTLVVQSVDAGRRIGLGKTRMVTLEGDLLEMSGAMHGGFRGKRKGVGFQEVELSKNMNDIEGKLADLRTKLAKAKNEKEENENAVYKLREEKATLEGEIIKQEKSLHLDTNDLESTRKDKNELEEKIKSAEKTLEEVQEKIMDANRELAQAKSERQQVKSRIMSLRNPTVLAELNTLEERRKKLLEAMNELKAEQKGTITQITSIFLPEKENMEKILKQQEKETVTFKKELQDLKEHIKKKQEEMKVKEQEEKKFAKKFRTLFERRKKLQELYDKTSDHIEQAQELSRKAEHKMNTIGLDEARIKAELNTIKEDYAQYQDLKIKITKTEQELKKEIDDFEKMRENLGSINMRALEIYEQVETEYHKLVEKKEKLSEEKGEVMSMMEEIEGKKKELFLKTFNVINKNFQNKFASLSTKGKAFLELENEKDPFSGGVGIKVKLKGNKFMDIRGLSGGEKTMTALAFIFAMQEHEPASFYVLDEVDAALDKHNSEKLADLVRSYCGHAQYVIISHNDSVITEADTLYGVSMNTDNVSKVTSLKV